MKILPFALAAIFFILGLLYGLGFVQFGTHDGGPGVHHIKHMIGLWIVAFVALVWARFQSQQTSR